MSTPWQTVGGRKNTSQNKPKKAKAAPIHVASTPLGTTTRYDEAFNGKERKRLKAEEEARKAKADAKKAEEDAARARKQRESQRDRARGSRPLRPTATMSEALAQVNVKAVMEAANKGRETVPDRKEYPLLCATEVIMSTVKKYTLSDAPVLTQLSLEQLNTPQSSAPEPLRHALEQIASTLSRDAATLAFGVLVISMEDEESRSQCLQIALRLAIASLVTAHPHCLDGQIESLVVQHQKRFQTSETFALFWALLQTPYTSSRLVAWASLMLPVLVSTSGAAVLQKFVVDVAESIADQLASSSGSEVTTKRAGVVTSAQVEQLFAFAEGLEVMERASPRVLQLRRRMQAVMPVLMRAAIATQPSAHFDALFAKAGTMLSQGMLRYVVMCLELDGVRCGKQWRVVFGAKLPQSTALLRYLRNGPSEEEGAGVVRVRQGGNVNVGLEWAVENLGVVESLQDVAHGLSTKGANKRVHAQALEAHDACVALIGASVLRQREREQQRLGLSAWSTLLRFVLFLLVCAMASLVPAACYYRASAIGLADHPVCVHVRSSVLELMRVPQIASLAHVLHRLGSVSL